MLTWSVVTFPCEHCPTTDLDAVDLWLRHVETARFLSFSPSLVIVRCMDGSLMCCELQYVYRT